MVKLSLFLILAQLLTQTNCQSITSMHSWTWPKGSNNGTGNGNNQDLDCKLNDKKCQEKVKDNMVNTVVQNDKTIQTAKEMKLINEEDAKQWGKQMIDGVDGALEFMGTNGWKVVSNSADATWGFVQPKIAPTKKVVGETCNNGWCMFSNKVNQGWLSLKPKMTNNITNGVYNTVSYPFKLVKNSKTWQFLSFPNNWQPLTDVVGKDAKAITSSTISYSRQIYDSKIAPRIPKKKNESPKPNNQYLPKTKDMVKRTTNSWWDMTKGVAKDNMDKVVRWSTNDSSNEKTAVKNTDILNPGKQSKGEKKGGGMFFPFKDSDSFVIMPKFKHPFILGNSIKGKGEQTGDDHRKFLAN